MSGWLDNPILTVLEKGLNASSLRQKVLADNVANVDTPGFKRSDVDFQQALNAALGTRGSTLSLKTSVPRHIGIGTAENQSLVQTDHSTSLRNDSNNVDIDREMTNVAENGLYYNALTRTISSQLGMLRMVIK
ncbi:flagellar basal body rod protein FlgB [Desulfosporosinus sp. BICA1-9]|uniref:flagellar basal body rod protein FlgB n=1 Tax=Desulfosporosinus sp. BICA1-9 TaxID=1531958 RepID=UPI00054C7971|nr:flagellar basal body rod protein FlgB [Desulfosporosinus sp. BICA1-9]KJS47190.1 MAG: flagellar basal-body rod protein FlgB [Peptococcaceae bacterium BRH_c23]KJS90002.1 MAG: flagellar basal-body rod protein FlgB [Desulfosporosinus sp. BICA1-9]HBW36410.1 flagellar basal body rod protein FlgB [Desulfosporosinus sp.]